MNTQAYAVEVILTRRATRRELQRARAACPYGLAASPTRSRLLCIVPASGLRRGLHLIWQDLSPLLPIDVLTTVFADAHGEHLISVQVEPELKEAIQRQAAKAGRRMDEHLRETVVQAVSGHESERRAQTDAALSELLQRSSPDEVLAALARVVLRR